MFWQSRLMREQCTGTSPDEIGGSTVESGFCPKVVLLSTNDGNSDQNTNNI